MGVVFLGDDNWRLSPTSIIVIKIVNYLEMAMIIINVTYIGHSI